MISNTGISLAAISIFLHISHRICANIGMKSGHRWEGAIVLICPLPRWPRVGWYLWVEPLM